MNSTFHQTYVIIIPAYNEEKSIARALNAIEKAATYSTARLRKVLICINGCTDHTEQKIIDWNKNKKLPIKLLYSDPGYGTAVNTLFAYAREHYPKDILIKTDADSIMKKNVINILLDQFVKHPKLVIVGGHPLPAISPNLSPIQSLLAKTFSLRSTYPLAQVAAHDVAKYHQACLSDQQPIIGSRELRLKTFFHGRLWSVRSSDLLPSLAEDVIGDDVYLTAWIYKKYGPGAIRVMYNANTLSAPNNSLRRHWMVYKRIHEDVKRIAAMPEYAEIELLQKTKLDWTYIITQVPLGDKLRFVLYAGICRLELISFENTIYREHYWQYKEKEQ